MLPKQLKILLEIALYTLLGALWIYSYHYLAVSWWLLIIFLSVPLVDLLHIVIWQRGETVVFVLLEYFVSMAGIIRELLLLSYNLLIAVVKVAAVVLILVCIILLAGISLWVIQQFGINLYQNINLEDLKLFLKWFTIFAIVELVFYLIIMLITRLDPLIIRIINKIKLN